MTARLSWCVFMLAAVGLPASQAIGQHLAPGARVRFQPPELRRPVVGTVMQAGSDSLTIAVPVRGARPDTSGAVRHYHVPATLTGISVSAGRSRGQAIKRGLITGLVLGVVAAGIGLTLEPSGEADPLQYMVAIALPPAVAIASGAFGALFTVERWARVSP